MQRFDGWRIFLSTPSARRATYILSDVGCIGLDFYPRPPRGGRLLYGRVCAGLQDFYPRPPRGGRHHFRKVAARYKLISIHALREEGDKSAERCAYLRRDFYPRPPRGGRRGAPVYVSVSDGFLSTPSARRATPAKAGKIIARSISIHALREEGDCGVSFAVST